MKAAIDAIARPRRQAGLRPYAVELTQTSLDGAWAQ